MLTQVKLTVSMLFHRVKSTMTMLYQTVKHQQSGHCMKLSFQQSVSCIRQLSQHQYIAWDSLININKLYHVVKPTVTAFYQTVKSTLVHCINVKSTI